MIDSNVLLSQGEFFPALSLLEKGRSSRSASVQMDRIDLAAHPQPGLDELLRIHEYERQRLGQELHDSTGQLVVVLLLSLARLKVIEHDGASMHVIDDMQDIVRQIDKEIRSLAFLHYPADLANGSLAASIEKLVAGFASRTGTQVSFSCQGGTPAVEAALSMDLLRITQEALVNVHRHSQATSAHVELKNQGDQIELRITDDGVGLSKNADMTATGGIGLAGMRYRVEAHGGSFEVRNQHPGAMVRAVVPIAN